MGRMGPYSRIKGDALGKLTWAQHHIAEIEAECEETFRNLYPSPVATKVNPKTGDLTYYIQHLPPIPERIALQTGDVLHSLRSALDYMACGLVRLGGEVPQRNTKFPIARSAEDFPALLGKLIPGLGQNVRETINSFHPYKGGNKALWALHTLNNLDKHRILLTVVCVNPVRSLTPGEKATMENMRPRTTRLGTRYFFGDGTARKQGGLNTGDKLLTVRAAEAQMKVSFHFDVAPDEPDIPEGLPDPLTLLLHFLAQEVSLVVRELGFHLC